ncbi:dienelactone hydrolase family protein [Thermostaphylospora chromogena]|uniref:Dienelactone hydrolase n=1 Tax=Thermostaphylospora chromogena TaxID=35622 RepID=A0A1H1D1T6_9ACTN|nr:alpha/beta fold hydrolase [Thermostaphylospora chromogena]SDQ70414.1 Dienelactone hydrolase [Thermostaphylospora chromogena]
MTVQVSRRIPAGGVLLDADVALPDDAHGIVIFAHGSGSSRHSPRNRYVAEELRRAGLGTVLADLLTPDEERADTLTGEHRFDIAMLADRLGELTDRIATEESTRGLSVGLFGASTGAAAALIAAARRPERVRAVVSRGGRPDLAGEELRAVHQPTLFIVGERDPIVIELNQEAMERMGGETRLEIIPTATHLFEERGTLEQVAHLAEIWFLRHLAPRQAR